MLTLKYASPQIGSLEESLQGLWADALLLKIHVITGWVIPEKELLNILTDQFQKKLVEDYGHLNVEEVEYAFRKSGTTIKDWGKAMNLSLIDEVLLPYARQRSELSRNEERKAAPVSMQVTAAQLDDLHRGDVEAFYQRCRSGVTPRGLPNYFKDILVKDGLMKQEETLVDFFTNRLGKGSLNIYIKSE